MLDKLRYLLLQVRDGDDPMRQHEVDCFARSLHAKTTQIEVVDLLRERPSWPKLGEADMVLLGGSGDYSVVKGGPWLEPALDVMRELHACSKPTFASCWGFQAMTRALGGEVVTDLGRAEVGTCTLTLTPEGERDPIFGPLGHTFRAQMGHQDIVDRLPPDTVLLASTELVQNQAFRFSGKPMYCTQFHPELNRSGLLDRMRTYPQYVERIVGLSFDEFAATTIESFETEAIMLRFARQVAGV